MTSQRLTIETARLNTSDMSSPFVLSPSEASQEQFEPIGIGEIVSIQVLSDPEYALKVLSRIDAVDRGWCQLVTLAPTKQGGYVQVSFEGANKFMMLQQVVAAANNQYLVEESDQCSHLCHEPLCKVPSHVVVESREQNNQRKGCLVWVDCLHCCRPIVVCPHEPRCIKYSPRYANQEQLEANKCRG